MVTLGVNKIKGRRKPVVATPGASLIPGEIRRLAFSGGAGWSYKDAIMNRTTIALLVLAAAGASAQMTMPRIDTRPAHKSSVEAAYGSVGADSGDFGGSVLTARLYFYGNAFVSVGRNDVSFDGTAVSAHQFAYGVGTTEAWGQGTVTAAYARAKVAGDIASVDQNLFSVGYELGLASGLTGGFTVAHFQNAGVVNDVTAAIFSARYEIAGGLSLTASYSSEDTVLGRDGGKHSWTVGARYAF